MFDLLNAVPDLVSHVQASGPDFAIQVQSLVPTAVGGKAEGAVWNWSWTPPNDLQEITRKIAFFLGVIWVFYVISQFVIPGKRGGGRNVKLTGIIMVLFAIVVLCNLNLVPAIINGVGRLAYLIGQLFGLY